MERFVVGITGDETAQQAGRAALDLARRVGASVHFVTAVQEDRSSVVGIGDDAVKMTSTDAAEADIRSFLASADADVPYTVAVVAGDPAKALIAEAERTGADLIIVGNVRMQGVRRILGSVGNDVAHHAPVNVLIVKTT
jgi:nucleotide-binding universal stress UspA family protein